MSEGIGARLAAERQAAAAARAHHASLWMPLSALESIARPTFVGVDSDPTGWRFETLRAGWDRWLRGVGSPLPPIVLFVGRRGELRLADGNHRLTTAREMGVPLLAKPRADFPGQPPALFGWRRRDDAAELLTLSGAELMGRMHAPSVEEAEKFRAELLGCIERRSAHTGEDFAIAARAMFNAPGLGLAVKVCGNWSDPRQVMADLVLGLGGLPTVLLNAHAFLLAHAPPDAATRAHYAATATPTLRNAQQALESLIRALEGERQ